MKNMKNYIAPDVELVRFSANEACMLTTSAESKSSNLVIDFDELGATLNI